MAIYSLLFPQDIAVHGRINPCLLNLALLRETYAVKLRTWTVNFLLSDINLIVCFGLDDEPRCLALIRNDKSLCDDYRYPSSCIQLVIQYNNKQELCPTTDFPGECYFNIAKNTNNADLCNLSLDPSRCFLEIAIATANPQICKNLEFGYGCITTIAANTMNSKICELIDVEMQRQRCYYSVAIKAKISQSN